MAQHPKIDLLVAYCSLHGAEAALDPGFGVEVKWDIPLLDGYPWIQVPNRSLRPGLGRFFGLVNPDLWHRIRTEQFDAVHILTGYNYLTFWIVAAIAKSTKTALLFGTDAHELSPQGCPIWKTRIKKLLLPHIFGLADTVTVLSSGGVKFIHSLGIPEQRIQLTPFVVDNDWWISQAQKVDQGLVRQQWNIPTDAFVILFCAKLQSRKRPQDALQAFAKVNLPNSYLVFAGDGVLRADLEAETKSFGIEDQVRFLGFVNQSQLPSTYRSADLFVFSSEHEPFGVVVNEAMLCGCPVVVSNRVGARYDLVCHGETGFVYPCSDVNALAEIMRLAKSNPKELEQISTSASKQMKTWSPHENVEAILQALEKL